MAFAKWIDVHDVSKMKMFEDMVDERRVERLLLPADAGRGMASALARGSTATTVGETLLYRRANMLHPYPKVKPPSPQPAKPD